MTPIDQFFKPEDIVYTYTSKQAVEDAILFDLDQVRKYLPKNPFKYATVNLLGKGYFSQEDAYGNFKVKIPNVIDLIMGALMIYCRKPVDDYSAADKSSCPVARNRKSLSPKTKQAPTQLCSRRITKMPQSHLYDLDEMGVGVCRHLVAGFNHKTCGTRLVPSKHGDYYFCPKCNSELLRRELWLPLFLGTKFALESGLRLRICLC